MPRPSRDVFFNAQIRVSELEEELKEAKNTINQLSQFLKEDVLKKKEDRIKELRMDIQIAALENELRAAKATGNNDQPNQQETSGSQGKWEEFMERMEERAKRQEDLENILLEKMRGQEETMAEIKKSMDVEIGMIQKQLNLLQRTVEDIEKKCDATGNNRRQETIQTENKSKAAIDHAELPVTRKTRRDLFDIEEFIKEQQERLDFKWKVDSLLIGDLEVLRTRIELSKNEIRFESGFSFTIEGLQEMIERNKTTIWDNIYFQHALSVIQDPLWILIPEKYEVKCSFNRCDKMICLTNIREDGVSVRCPQCSWCTPLGLLKEGFIWKRAQQCNHFQQVKFDENPEKCLLCGIEFDNISGVWDRCARIPRRK